MTRINVVLVLPRGDDGGTDAAFFAAMLRGFNKRSGEYTWAIAVNDEFVDGQGIDPQELITGVPGRVEQH